MGSRLTTSAPKEAVRGRQVPSAKPSAGTGLEGGPVKHWSISGPPTRSTGPTERLMRRPAGKGVLPRFPHRTSCKERRPPELRSPGGRLDPQTWIASPDRSPPREKTRAVLYRRSVYTMLPESQISHGAPRILADAGAPWRAGGAAIGHGTVRRRACPPLTRAEIYSGVENRALHGTCAVVWGPNRP
jgi:hypothetical protein